MRYLLSGALVAAVVGVAALTGCSSVSEAVDPIAAGDCVQRDGEDFNRVGCEESAAEYTVLEKQEFNGSGCLAVAGATYVFSNTDVGTLCLGEIGADPATAPNVAQPGDCLTGVSDPEEVRKLPCDHAEAEYKVLAREKGQALESQQCTEVAGTQARFTWELRSEGKNALPKLGPDIVFCLADKNSDPTRSIDNAEVGDCLRKTEHNPGMELTECSASDAAYRVLRKTSSSALCQQEPDAVQAFTLKGRGMLPQVFCLGAV